MALRTRLTSTHVEKTASDVRTLRQAVVDLHARGEDEVLEVVTQREMG